jgi:Terminase large subunit, T4likevirus-type, N-terminal
MRGLDELQLAVDPARFFAYVAERQRRPLGKPLEYQRKVLRSTSKRLVLVAGRQTGKSSCLAARALWQALFTPGSLTLLVAPTERQSKILFAKVARMYRAFGGKVDATSARRLGLELENDSQIEALPGSPGTIQGFSADLLIVDEAGFISEELLDAATPSLAATDGTLILAGRPAGKRGPLYHTWVHATDYEKHMVRADECPLITPGFLASERRRMTEREYASQYLCSFEDAEDAVFREHLIERAFVDEPALWSDFSTGTAEYYYDPDAEQWRSAEELLLGRPKRSLEVIERDINSYLSGAPNLDPDRLLDEYREAKGEQEALGHG